MSIQKELSEPFGGEGEGLHYLNKKTGWKLNRWYRQVVREWSYNGHTYFGMWSCDVRAKQWVHHVTFDFPVPNMSFCKNALSFLENWSGNNPDALRRASFTGGWKRFENQFVPLNSAYVDGDLTFYGITGVSSQQAIFMQTGAHTCNNSNTLSIQFDIPPFTEDNATPYIQTQNISIQHEILTYSWIVDTSQNPPFAYKIMLVDKTTRTVLATQQDINPEARSVQFDISLLNMPNNNLAIQAVIFDLYDVPHTTQINCKT